MVEIPQHVEITHTVSKQIPVGSVIIPHYYANTKPKDISTFMIVHPEGVITFIGKNLISFRELDRAAIDKGHVILEDADKKAYLYKVANGVLEGLGHLIESITL